MTKTVNPHIFKIGETVYSREFNKIGKILHSFEPESSIHQNVLIEFDVSNIEIISTKNLNIIQIL